MLIGGRKKIIGGKTCFGAVMADLQIPQQNLHQSRDILSSLLRCFNH